MRVTLHVVHNLSVRPSVSEGRTTRHAGYGVSLRISRQIEEAFGWIKTITRQDKTKFHGRPSLPPDRPLADRRGRF